VVGAGDFCVRDPGVAVLAIVLFGGYPAFGHFQVLRDESA